MLIFFTYIVADLKLCTSYCYVTNFNNVFLHSSGFKSVDKISVFCYIIVDNLYFTAFFTLIETFTLKFHHFVFVLITYIFNSILNNVNF